MVTPPIATNYGSTSSRPRARTGENNKEFSWQKAHGRPRRNAQEKKPGWNVRKKRSNAVSKTVSAARMREAAPKAKTRILPESFRDRNPSPMNGNLFPQTFMVTRKRKRKRTT